MHNEFLVRAQDVREARSEVKAAGGRLTHILTPHLLVVMLPGTVDVNSLSGLSAAEPERLDKAERVVAEAWISKFGDVSQPVDRLVRLAAAPAIEWDTPGFTQPDHLPGRDGPVADPITRIPRSTDTPTSTTLTGSVAVGVVMVSGPPDAPFWTSVHGALKYVSVGSDATVWGVNDDDKIFRWDGSGWTEITGRLKQVSVGDAVNVWGVNSDDEIYQWNGSSWTRITGALKHVSVASDGTVWGVNEDDKIYRWGGSSWQQVSGRLKQISVGTAAAVWGVNSDDEIYQWNGSSWTQVAGALKHVSVASDGTVWGVNEDDEIFRWNGGAWDQVAGRLTQISASSASLTWGVNSDDQIYTHDPGLGLAFTAAEKALIMSEVLEGLDFLAVAEPSANVSFVYDWNDITVDVAPGAGDDYEDFEAPWRDAALSFMGYSASRDGSVDYVNALRTNQQTDWAYVAYFTKYPLHHFAYAGDERVVMDLRNDNWGAGSINRVFAHETCHIFGAADEYEGCDCGGSGHFDVPNNNCKHCTSAQVPCLMNANTLSLCTWSRGQIGWSSWEQIAGGLKHVSVASDGTVWGVNEDDKIYRWGGTSWQQVSGRLKQISVGSAAAVWGVNSDDEIYQWNGSSWTQVAGALKHVSVASDGTVWGVNEDDEIYRWGGGAWDQVAGALKQLSAGAASLVWGVNDDDEIFRQR